MSTYNRHNNALFKIVCDGYSRDTILIMSFAIKVPSLRNGWKPFLLGLMGNIKELETWNVSKHPRLSRVLFCIPGGWLNVYPRYTIIERGLTPLEISDLPIYGHDPKIGNYGLDSMGNIMVLDYGHCDCWPKWTEGELGAGLENVNI